jgi:hypothetical protein
MEFKEPISLIDTTKKDYESCLGFLAADCCFGDVPAGFGDVPAGSGEADVPVCLLADTTRVDVLRLDSSAGLLFLRTTPRGTTVAVVGLETVSCGTNAFRSI